MVRRVLDTSVLIGYWKRRDSEAPHRQANDVELWAKELFALYDSRAIVSPIYLEFICGFSNRNDVELGKKFLAAFEVIDGWNVQPKDLQEALRIAQRVPPNGKPRQFADCLIRAMANRLNHEVFSLDQSFPKR